VTTLHGQVRGLRTAAWALTLVVGSIGSACGGGGGGEGVAGASAGSNSTASTGGVRAGFGGEVGKGEAAGGGADGGAAGTSGTDLCLDCATQHRACDSSSGQAGCGQCLPDFREQEGACVCPGGQVAYENKCATCADNFSPRCDAEGETGAVVRLSDATCICETMPGYFYSLETNRAEACDLDGDGWMNDGAQPALESLDPALSENARCAIRRVKRVLLVNAEEQTTSVALAPPFANAGLPLYESPRNDGASAATRHPSYGGVELSPRVLNSLTKACVTKNGDFNDNGISDVEEWAGKALAGRVTRNTALQSYYQQYLRFAYYLELYDGRLSAPGAYRVTERPRGEGIGATPQRYPEGADSYWQQCTRHIDRDYSGAPKSRAGGDFSEFGEDWGGMAQTSQFKCVEVVARSDYPRSTDRRKNPEVVFWSSAPPGFSRRSEVGGSRAGCPDPSVAEDIEVYDWTPNQCAATSVLRSPDGEGVGAEAFADIECVVAPTDPAFGLDPGVYWMSVGYESAACGAGATPTADSYIRGCINECAERTVRSCKNFDAATDPSSGRYTCDDENRHAFGVLQCGCGRHYAGDHCELGCPNDALFTSAQFNIETRAGTWMCGNAVASTGEHFGGPYRARGYLPFAALGGPDLVSADGKLRLGAR
jgi:hypothetical protein